MYLKYICMIALTGLWFSTAIILLILMNIYGEDWINRAYMTAFLSSSPIAVVCGITVAKNRMNLFKPKK